MNPALLATRLRLLLSSNAPPSDAAMDAAQQWSDLLQSARQRLDTAADWARRGLRTEALEHASAAPSLFALAETMRDPSLSGWPRYCERHRLPVPSELPSSQLELLGECHLQLEPMREALARWRKLNIGRAPATQRLDQFRVLRSLDPANPIWTSDAPAIERAALEEAVAACERGLALWQIDRVQAVVAWIEQGEWLDAPSGPTVAALRARITELSGRSALERARAVVDRLHQEYMAESLDAAQAHLGEWEALRTFLADAGVELPAELTASVQPVLEWIRERHEAAQRAVDQRTSIAELEARIESPTASMASLQSLLARVVSGPEPAPRSVIAAATRRIEALQRSRRLRVALVLAVVLAIVVVLAVATKSMLDRHAHRLEGERLLAAVQQWIDRGDPESADEVLRERRESDPRLAEHPAFDEASLRVAAARAAIAQRDAEFEARLAAAGDPAAPAASAASVEGLPELARTSDQRARLDAWTSTRQQAAADRQREIDAAFVATLAAIEGDVDRDLVAEDIEVHLLDQLVRRLDELDAVPGVSPAVRTRVRPLRVRLDTVRRTLDERSALDARRLAEQAALGQLPALARQPDAYAKALLRFADDFPDAPAAEGFRDAAIDLPAWRGAAAWPEVRATALRHLAKATDAERAEVRQRLRSFVEAHPLAAEVSAARRALGVFGDQDDWQRWLIGVLDGSPLMSLRSVELRNGERYYYESASAPQPTPDGQRVYRIVRSLQDPAKGLFDAEYLRLDPKQIVRDGDSPQRVLAQALRPGLRAGEPKGLDGALAMIRRWRDATDVDPVLRAEIIAGLLQQVRASAPPLAPLIDEAERRLAAFDLEHLSWLDPRHAEAREIGKQIEVALPGAIEPDRWAESWRREIADVGRLLAPMRQVIGLVLLEGDSATLLANAPPTAGLLQALVVDGGVARYIDAGVVDASLEARFDAKALPMLHSGTPIFQERAAGSIAAPPGAPESPIDRGGAGAPGRTGRGGEPAAPGGAGRP